jgi:predicted phage terminase large subunit-like protein
MQRLHEDDVSGTAISRKMGYTHLMIPMLHDSGRHCHTVLGVDDEGDEVIWEDPREEDGELAWPERFPENTVEELERDKGPYAFASQYQQSPEPRGGSIIKRDFWKMWGDKFYPNCEYILASLDTAYGIKESNDFSALTIWGIFRETDENVTLIPRQWTHSIPTGVIHEAGEKKNAKVFLLYAWRQRLEFNDLVQRVIDTCTKDERKVVGPRFKVDRIIVEAKASGMSVAQELRRLVAFDGRCGIELIKLKGSMDKVARLHSVQHLFSEGLVYAPGYLDTLRWRDYAAMVIDELAVFPHASHDDLVDSTSMAMRYLRDNGFMLREVENELENKEEMIYRGRELPLYPV